MSSGSRMTSRTRIRPPHLGHVDGEHSSEQVGPAETARARGGRGCVATVRRVGAGEVEGELLPGRGDPRRWEDATVRPAWRRRGRGRGGAAARARGPETELHANRERGVMSRSSSAAGPAISSSMMRAARAWSCRACHASANSSEQAAARRLRADARPSTRTAVV